MPAFTLRIAARGNTVTVSLPVEDFVHKRIEKFVISKHVATTEVALDGYEVPKVTPEKYLRIIDKSWTLHANTQRMVDNFIGVQVGNRIVSNYDDLLITDKTTVNDFGVESPLWYSHIFIGGVKSCRVEIFARGFDKNLHSGWLLDVAAGKAFTNYQNIYDPISGNYIYYVLNYEDADGVARQTLLSTKSACSEATWQDIDPTTGRLYSGRNVFSKSEQGTSWAYHLSDYSKWWYCAVNDRVLKPLVPAAITARDPWYLRIQNSQISQYTNGAVKTYKVTEAARTPYLPYAPFVWKPQVRSAYMAKNVRWAAENLFVNVDDGLFLDALVYDVSGQLIKALTTDPDKDGIRYSSTNVFWEFGLIAGVDKQFVLFGIELYPSWDVVFSGTTLPDYTEIKKINLNPALNKELLNKQIIFYLIPNVDDQDDAIHYLIVDQQSKILSCSQGLGIQHPALSLMVNGAWNSDTVVGKTYKAATITNTFVKDYTAGYSNTYGYLILAEIGFVSRQEEDFKPFNLREQGSLFIGEAHKNTAIQSSIYTGGPLVVPQNKVLIIELPISLLEDYGGTLTQEKAEKLALSSLSTSVFPVIRWVYPQSTITAEVDGTDVILTCSFEGYGDYVLYRKANPEEVWTEIDTYTSAVRADIEFTDTANAGETWYYGVAFEGNPVPYALGVKV